jgi:hypothetical protein
MPNALQLGTRYRTIVHSAPSVPFSSGNVQSVELPKGYLYKNLYLRLRGEYEGTAGAASAGSEVPLALLQRIEVIGDGRDTIVNAAGRDLYRLAHIFHGKAGELQPPANFTAANQAISALITVPLEAARMAMSADSFFDPNIYEKVELRVTWGTVANISAGGTPTIDTANTFLDVQTGETTEGADRIMFQKQITHDEVNVNATSTAFRVRVPRTGLLHGILFRTDRDNVAVNNIVNRITLQSDNSFNHVDNLRWDFLQARNVQEYQLDGGAAPTNVITGYAFLDVTEDGLMSSALASTDMNALDLVLDVTRTSGTEVIRMTHVYYKPVLQAS